MSEPHEMTDSEFESIKRALQNPDPWPPITAEMAIRALVDKIDRLKAELKSIKDEYDIKSQGHDYYILDSIEKVK